MNSKKKEKKKNFYGTLFLPVFIFQVIKRAVLFFLVRGEEKYEISY